MKYIKYLGASTAAHQVEGNNIHSDFWLLEQLEQSPFKEPSLDAVDHYNRFKEDINLLKEAGFNAYRFSIEWARIEPIQNEFNQTEIDHYLEVIEYCKLMGIEPIITLHHFSSPKWVISEGGWEDERIVGFFSNYVTHTLKALGESVNYICTINEANMGLQLQMIMTERFKSMKNNNEVQVGVNINNMYKKIMEDSAKAFNITSVNHFLTPRTDYGDLLICKAHVAARNIIKKMYPNIKVGLTLSLHDFQANDDGLEFAQLQWEKEFLHYLPYIEADDFLGVQNYTRKVVNAQGSIKLDNVELTDAGYEFYPEGLEHVIRKVNKYFKKPLIITENGIATNNDERRIAFINVALNGVKRCVMDGIPVIGYLHWSLLDNFEWMLGYSQKFGLIEVDRKTQIRQPKPSFYKLSEYNKFL